MKNLNHLKNPAIIDGDSILYKAAIKGTTEIDWGDGKTQHYDLDVSWQLIEEVVKRIAAQTHSSSFLFCLSDNRPNYFRYDFYTQYKKGRPASKPPLYPQVLKMVQDKYPTLVEPRLEADDLLGLLSNLEGCTLVSMDKDLKQIPGKLYNWDKDNLSRTSLAEADYQFFYQCLVGDSCDGYPGLPKVGDKKAKILLNADCSWGAVVKAYEAKGLSKDDALIQARVARILRPGEYDWDTKEIKLWDGE